MTHCCHLVTAALRAQCGAGARRLRRCRRSRLAPSAVRRRPPRRLHQRRRRCQPRPPRLTRRPSRRRRRQPRAAAADGGASPPTPPAPPTAARHRATEPTATPTPTETPTPEPERARSFGSGNQVVNMRREPGTNSAVVKSVRDGTEVDRRRHRSRGRRSDLAQRPGRRRDRLDRRDGAAPAARRRPRPRAARRRPRRRRRQPRRRSAATTAPPTAVPSRAPPTATPIPEQVEVFGTGGGGANLRAEPATGGGSCRTSRTAPV